MRGEQLKSRPEVKARGNILKGHVRGDVGSPFAGGALGLEIVWV